MQDWDALNRQLRQSGKTDDLRKLAESGDARRLAGQLDADAVRRAASGGDSEALKKLMGSVLATEEGQRLARQLQKLLKK